MIPETIRQMHWNDVDWFYIQGLSKAIELVKTKYVRNIEGDNRFHVERVFAYELYYKWRTLLNEKSNNPLEAMLNGELTKHYYVEGKYTFPDMVLHGDYNDRGEPLKQLIICEIKSSRNTIEDNALKKDLESLQGGINILGYHCAVFVYLGDDYENMIRKLRNFDIIESGKVVFIGITGCEPHYEIL